MSSSVILIEDQRRFLNAAGQRIHEDTYHPVLVGGIVSSNGTPLLGGLAGKGKTSKRKAAAARENGKKGGAPRKIPQQ